MTEENIIFDVVDEEYDAFGVLDITPTATKSETIQVVNAEDVKTFTVSSEESFPAIGEPNAHLKHSTLMGRDLQDQHPITAITGLRDELDNIEALQTVYSDKKQSADFYKWEDENLENENRVGFFVSVGDDINTIKICNGKNIFGVTVDSAAFVGGQDDISRDYRYSLVTYSGIVNVRCELSVSVGDFVTSNKYGVAEKTNNDYGCKVIAINEINGLKCATVCLNMPIEQLSEIGHKLVDFDNRIDGTEKGVTAAMNLANEALNKATNADNTSGDALNNTNDAVDKLNDALDQLDGDISKIQAQVAEAITISQSASAHAENLRTEAVKTANETLKNVNELTAKYEPLETWVDPNTGKIGATYVINYMSENGLATTADIRTVDTKTEDNKSAIERNAESFTSLVSSVDKYSVGEYSQAYGLTLEQAKSILKVGMIYIPTENNSKKTHEEKYLDTGEINQFTKGYYYTWNGEDWDESTSGRVNFAKIKPSTTLNDYWYIDSNEAPSGYEPKTLYMVQGEGLNKEWVKVNTLSGNCNNRVSSMIRQTSNEIALEVVNARGSYSGLDARLDAENKAYTSMVASVVGTDGKVTAASIVAAVNGDSSVAINADKIVMTGNTTFLTAKDVGKDGSTSINGSRIFTGRISSVNCSTYIDLDEGTFLFSDIENYPKLELDEDRNLNVYGSIRDMRYPDFSIDIGPSYESNDYGAFTVNDNTNGWGKIFQVYGTVIGANGNVIDKGVVWTAPFLTNDKKTNRKGISIASNDITMFNDVGAPYVDTSQASEPTTYPWKSEVSVKEDAVVVSNGRVHIELCDQTSGFTITSGKNDNAISINSVHPKYYSGTRYWPKTFIFDTPQSGLLANIECQTVITKGYTQESDRALKTNIEEVELTALDKISQLKFYSYDYKTSEQDEFNMVSPTLYNSPSPDGENTEIIEEEIVEETTTSDPVHVDLGIMTDEAPIEIQSADGRGIDLYSYISLNAKAVQELILKIQTLEEEIQNLKNGEM